MPNLMLPDTQALGAQAFKAPRPLLEDQATTVLDIYAWNAVENTDHPLFRFQDNDEITTITWGEAVEAIRRAAAFFASQVNEDATLNAKPPVVAILANLGAVGSQVSEQITLMC